MTRLNISLMITVSIALATVWGLFLVLGSSSAPVIHGQGTDGHGFYYVAPGGDCGGQLPCFSSVQAAVDAADDPDDEVLIATGVYTSVNSYGGSAQVVYISKTVTVRGGYSSDFGAWNPDTYPTSLDAVGLGRPAFITGVLSAVQGQTATVTMQGLRITGGDASGLIPSLPLGGLGGGVCVYTATVIMSNCTIDGNTANASAPGSGHGGGLFLLGSVVTVTESKIENNTAGQGGQGGGLWCRQGTTTLTDNLVQSNLAGAAASGEGGGLYFDSCTVSLSGNRIIGNVASGGAGSGDIGLGGGLSLRDSTATVSGNTVQDNIASTGRSGRGGGVFSGVWVGESIVSVIGNTITNNTATAGTESDGSSGKGGGLYLEDSTVHVSDNRIAGNTASTAIDGLGGGVFIESCTATLNGNTVQSNTASMADWGHGGGIFIYSGGTATLNSNVVQGNVASTTSRGGGGGLHLGYCAATLDGNAFISNTATMSPTALGEGGGLAILRNPSFTLTNNLVADNHANTAGSGVWCEDSSHGELIHTTIVSNRGRGDGVYVGEYSTLALTNTIIANHHRVGITVTVGSTATLEATLWGNGDWSNGDDWGGAGTILTGTISQWGNPLFVDHASGDYHIGAGSPAIDAGIDVGVDADIDRDARPKDGDMDGSSIADIGADEFRPPLRVHLPLVLR